MRSQTSSVDCMAPPSALSGVRRVTRLPSSFTVRAHGRADDLIAFDAVDAQGDLVLSDGVLRA